MKRLFILACLVLTGAARAQTQYDRILLNQNAAIVQDYASHALFISVGQLVALDGTTQVIGGTTYESVVLMSHLNTTGVLGVATSAGASGTIISIALLGQVPFLLTDNACTNGNFLGLSSTIDGDADCSSSAPTSEAIGFSFTTTAGPGTVAASIYLGGSSGGGGGGGGGSPAGSTGDLQMKNGSSFAASHLNDNGTTITGTESLSLGNNLFYQLQNNSHTMTVEAGARTGGGFANLNANSTFLLPDLANGSSFNTSGALLGITSAAIATSAGDCLYSLGTGQGGLMADSGMGCNGQITLPSVAAGVNWKSGSNLGSLAPVSGGLTASRSWFLPDASGTVCIANAGTTGCGGANQNLSNLLATAINQDLVPSGTHALGSAANPWNDLFTNFGAHSYNLSAVTSLTLPPSANITGIFYQTVDSGGTAQTQRPALNLIAGSNMTVSCVDNAPSTRTDCTLTSTNTAATSFSAITAATNPNTGNFIINGGGWDFTSAAKLLVPAAPGYIPTANASIGYNTTTNLWGFGQNGVDLTLPQTLSAVTHQFVTSYASSSGIFTLSALASGDIPNNAANTTGNAATATALALAPSTCTSTQAATGVGANGNATGCWSPAQTSLSNLTSTAVNQSLIPGLAATYDLGSAALPWNNGFFNANVTVGGSVTANSFVLGGGATTFNFGSPGGSCGSGSTFTFGLCIGDSTLGIVLWDTLSGTVRSVTSQTANMTTGDLPIATGNAKLGDSGIAAAKVVHTLSAQAQTTDSLAANGGTQTFATTYTFGANVIGNGNLFRVCANGSLSTSGTPPTSISWSVTLGGTTVYSTGGSGLFASQTNIPVGMCWLIQGMAAPSAASNVMVTTNNENDAAWFGVAATSKSGTAQPVSLATNGSLPMAFKMTSNTSDASTSWKLLQLTEEQLQ